ncbi:MAG: hypothetical protein ACXVKL_15860 [Candidatus Angelobacter sp.]
MKPGSLLKSIVKLAGLATAAYAGYVGFTWLRYGKTVHRTSSLDDDALLNRFMPVYEVAECHQVRVAAPAEMTLAAACESDLQQSPIIRSLFRGRELLLGSGRHAKREPRGLLDELKGYGWGVLAENPGREIVMGTVTQPWVANVEFRTLPPDEFVGFGERGYVKIAFTLRADPLSPTESIFRTETRVMTSDASARAKFRRYWSFLSPGILLIRRVSLILLKRTAEAEAGRLRSQALPRAAVNGQRPQNKLDLRTSHASKH